MGALDFFKTHKSPSDRFERLLLDTQQKCYRDWPKLPHPVDFGKTPTIRRVHVLLSNTARELNTLISAQCNEFADTFRLEEFTQALEAETIAGRPNFTRTQK